MPIQLHYLQSDNTEKKNWQNPRPSSPRYCRSIRLQLIHETTDIIKSEKEYEDNKIGNLEKRTVLINDKTIKINHILLFTMIDGKVCNAISSTSS